MATHEPVAICSLTGRACKCAIGQGCGRGCLDPAANEAVRWAKSADIRISDAVDALDLALDGLMFERTYPAPEWRETQRLLAAARALLKDTLK